MLKPSPVASKSKSNAVDSTKKVSAAILAAKKESFFLRKLFAAPSVVWCHEDHFPHGADLILSPSPSPQRHLEEASHPEQDQRLGRSISFSFLIGMTSSF